MSKLAKKRSLFGWKFKLGVVVLILGVGAYFVLTRHFAVTPRGFVVVPKEKLTINDTLVDIRDWGAVDLISHQDTVKALIRAGHADKLPHASRLIDQLNKDFDLEKNLKRLQDQLKGS